MAAESSLVLVATEAGVQRWTLNRPEALNAFNRPLLEALLAVVESARSDRSVRCAILTGAGDKAFSAGADLKERQGMTLDETRSFVRLISSVFDAVARSPFPTIAAVNGVAFGGGMELALACDLRVVADTAKLGLTEVSVGIMPGAGGTQRLPRIVGLAHAKELIFSARRVEAREALDMGLANRVVPAALLQKEAEALAAQIATQAPLAVRQAKLAIDAGLSESLAGGLEIEQKAYAVLLDTKDRLEGLAAFAEKRPPRYVGSDVLALPVLRLKKDRDKTARAGHPWLFSGAFEALPSLEPGSLCRIEDDRGGFVAIGYANPERSLAVRLLAWHEIDSVTDLLEQRIDAALELRKRTIPADTDAYRLISSEGDFLPGLVVDRYADVLVVQVQTAGMERLLDRAVEILAARLQPRTIYERSDIPVRREEGLPMRKRLVQGEPLPEEIEIREHGLRFGVQPESGQKTGFFLDQRDHRARVRGSAAGRKVLNCFAYTGGFSVAALAGGAKSVTSVESSQPAIELLRRNMERNGFPAGEVVHGDAFDLLRARRAAGQKFDLVILDPPAFAKKRHQVDAAMRGYKEINRQALELLTPGGELFTFSCSQYVDAPLFQRVAYAAAAEAGLQVQLLARLGHPADHPVNLAHSEGEYLKGFHLRVAGR